jgi:hypothetical protein
LRGGFIDAPPCERGATPNATLIQSLVLFSVFEMSSARIRRHAAITKHELKVLRLRKRCAYSSQALAIFSRQANSSLRTRLIGEMGTGSFWTGRRMLVAREDGEGDEIDRQARSRGNAAVSWSRRS